MNIIKKKNATGINSLLINSNYITVKGKTISSGKTGTFKVFNTTGVLMFKQQNISSFNTELSPGIYIVEFEGKDGIHATKKIAI
jgi:hypothetical protein